MDSHPADQEYELSGAEAVLAATLALMTGHAQSACASQQTWMAHKIRTHLDLLYRHPGLSLELRRMIHSLHHHWQVLAGPSHSCPSSITWSHTPSCRYPMASWVQ